MSTPVAFEDNLINFSSSLYNALEKTESVCVSPYSVTAALLLVMLGARGGSRDEILSALFRNGASLSEDYILKTYKSMNDELVASAGENVTLASANRLFVNKKFTVVSKVRTLAKTYFGADISLKDFTKPKISAAMINRWVSKQTNDKIKDLIKEDMLDDMTVMFIINAVYFKATWVNQFDPADTTREDFFVSNTTFKVDMMKLRTFVNYTRKNSYSAISLPFKGDNFEMVFVLPNKNDGLGDLELLIKEDKNFLKNVMDNSRENLVSISLPKFTVESETDLTKVLPRVGIKEIFIPDTANFSGLIEQQKVDMYVKYAIHKVFLNIDEAGAEGAAATAIGISIRTAGPNFMANHPFLFFIKQRRTRTILFLGKYQPKGQ